MADIKKELTAYLEAQGLQPQVEDFGIHFRYQMLNFWFLTDEKDQQYLRLVMPGVMDVDENNRTDVLEACNSVSNFMKVAKCFISDNNDVWIACEQLLDQDPKLENIIPRSLGILQESIKAFREAIDS